MISLQHRCSDLLDDAGQAMTRLWHPWLALLWCCELPLWALLVLIGQHLLLAGEDAHKAVDHFRLLITCCLLALPLAIYGRARFAQAMQASLGLSGRGGDKLPPLGWRRYLLHCSSSAVVLLTSWGLGFMLLPPLLLLWTLPLSTAVAAQADHCSLKSALGDAVQSLSKPKTLLLWLFFTALGAFLLFINLHGLITGAVTLTGAWGGWRMPAVVERLHWNNPLYLMLLLGGSAWLMQPFLLASAVAHVFRLRARRSGEDLLVWLRELEDAA